MTELYIFRDLEGNEHQFKDITKAFEFKEQYDFKHGLKNDLDCSFSKEETSPIYIYSSNAHKKKKKLRQKKRNKLLNFTH